MFESLTKAPDDPILGLKAAFDRDPHPNKVNLSAGGYKDAQGQTPVFRSVKLAEVRLLEEETSKDYLPIDGAPRFDAAVQALVLGPAQTRYGDGRTITAHTPGGTGALRVGAELIRRARPAATIWVSQPTWPNHPNVFRAAGLAVETYPYFDAATNRLRYDDMLATLGEATPGDVVLLHGCCHNPTGLDPTEDQWHGIGVALADRGLTPFVDFAYQGLADGLAEDTRGVAALSETATDMLVASSFSKNFGLYNERVGALTVIAADATQAAVALSHLKQAIRANYSNPPAHGARAVEIVLGDAELNALWQTEVTAMRDRINAMRRLFVERLAAHGVRRDFSFVADQRGMFSFTGLSKEQVAALRERYGIYLIDSGRMNVAGLTAANVDTVCAAIAEVLGES
jgi:aspartate/tyrosine/aromatic aminotransferase